MFDKVKSYFGSDGNEMNNSIQNIKNQYSQRQYANHIEYDSRTLGIDIQADIEKLKNFYRGRRLSSDGRTYEFFPGAQVIMTEAAAEWLLSNHENMLSVSNATSNITSPDEIKIICEQYGGNLTEILCSEYRNWEIDKSFFDLIIDGLTTGLQLFLNKAYADKQRSHMHGTYEPPPPPPQPMMQPP